MNSRIFIIPVFIALVGFALCALRPTTTSAQSPTEEPTKRPYTFPTPLFIPTYPNDTPAPPRQTPAASRAVDQPTGEQTYTVQPGDSLWTIAEKVYGNGSKYTLIMDANELTRTTRLRTGTVLKIPAIAGAPTLTSTLVPPSPILTPTAIPTTAFQTPTLSPTATSLIPASIVGATSTAINILSALLVLAAISSAVLAYLSYARARRLEQIKSGKRPLRLRQ